MWQTASDFLIFLGWSWQNITEIIKDIFTPVRYIYTFLQQFVASAFATPPAGPEIWSFSAGIKAVFESIPYFSLLIQALVLGLVILFSIFILKTFLKT